MKKLILIAGLSILCYSSNAQDSKQKEGSRLLFCQNLLSSERMLLLSLQNDDYARQHLFMSEASKAAGDAYHIFLRDKVIFQKYLSQQEMSDLETMCGFLIKEGNKEDFSENEPMKIALWCQLTDIKLEKILPKILK